MEIKSLAIESLKELPYEVKYLLLQKIYSIYEVFDYEGFAIMTPSELVYYIDKKGKYVEETKKPVSLDMLKTFCMVFSQENWDALESIRKQETRWGG